MRRKQTALLITLLLLSSLAFVSQTRPQSSVSSTDPITADRGGPPVTDEDGDRIPDLHESIFGDVRLIESSTGVVSVSGLDPMNATDNMSDHDNDGASALMEFCWPYTLDTCFDRLSLTGKPPQFTESGLREYLDPRVADTDGDGLPDGYEIYMCTEGGLGYQNATNSWQCLWFDPLDPSDSIEDIDKCEDFSFGCGDGFDVNRDGYIDVGERYTNSEEYLYGTPEDWLTERDGLWCAGEIPGLTDDSCQTEIARATNDRGWLGSDPTEPDSDYYTWSEVIAIGLAVPGDAYLTGGRSTTVWTRATPAMPSRTPISTGGTSTGTASSFPTSRPPLLIGARRSAITRSTWYTMTREHGLPRDSEGSRPPRATLEWPPSTRVPVQD